MAMSDCAKCWDTPCSCGWDYRTWTPERRIRQAAVILGVTPEALTIVDVPEVHPMNEQNAQRRSE